MTDDSESILIDTKRYLHEVVSEIVTYGQERGEFRTDVANDDLALFINRSMRSIFLDWAISNAGYDLVAEGVRFLHTIICPALQKDQPTFSV